VASGQIYPGWEPGAVCKLIKRQLLPKPTI
jgi:hypothetical protein